jgi:alpha-ketoglutarate-dependent taurine dioxygenase
VNAGAEKTSPFDLRAEAAWQAWRTQKLAARAQAGEIAVVSLADPQQLTPAERDALVHAVRRQNWVVYDTGRSGQALDAAKDDLRALGTQFGLHALDPHLCADEDGITPLSVQEGNRRSGYIPYTNRPINWHTDGYYNAPEGAIRGMALHCVQPAAQGGENAIADHELVYLRMREENPVWVAALMQPDAMTIPANAEGDTVLRADVSSPVFRVEPQSGNLHMRFTARTRNIVWKDNPQLREAVAWLLALLNEEMPNLSEGLVFRATLKAGQGLLCNNVLHTRTGFEDDPAAPRVMLRGRYHERVAGTDVHAA